MLLRSPCLPSTSRRPAQASPQPRIARNTRVALSSWRDYFADEGPTAAEKFFEEEYEVEEASTSAPRERFSGVAVDDRGAVIRRTGSSWSAREKGVEGGIDYLQAIGAKQLYNINVSHGQNVEHIDSLFTGNVLGHQSDIADGSLRAYDFRVFDNIVGDYYVAPAFLEKIALHMAKNYLVDMGAITGIRVPLILGVWGEKGMGKTFQTELALKKLGAETVVMSSGELEHEWAGTPGKLIRERYAKASEMSKVRGKMTALLIHDLDAGLGHFDHVQVTVNNQIVIGTLMNICDNPNQVSTGGEWRTVEKRIRRTPIIVTGNDFSKMFAPLIRDGRMDKFYWSPTREDLVSIVWQMYKEDGLTRDDVSRLLDRFRRQPLDFFGALRASTYDEQIRRWISREITGEPFSAESASPAALHKSLLSRDKSGLPTFTPVRLTYGMLVAEGERLEHEQQQVLNFKLSADYLRHVGKERERKEKAAAQVAKDREAAKAAGKKRLPTRPVRQQGFGG